MIRYSTCEKVFKTFLENYVKGISLEFNRNGDDYEFIQYYEHPQRVKSINSHLVC